MQNMGLPGSTPNFPITRIEVSLQGVAIITVLSPSYSTTTLIRSEEVEAIIQQLLKLKMQAQGENNVVRELNRKH